jgi:hypothetical protein
VSDRVARRYEGVEIPHNRGAAEKRALRDGLKRTNNYIKSVI